MPRQTDRIRKLKQQRKTTEAILRPVFSSALSELWLDLQPTLKTLAAQKPGLRKGDVEGHAFHGNQYTTGQAVAQGEHSTSRVSEEQLPDLYRSVIDDYPKGQRKGLAMAAVEAGMEEGYDVYSLPDEHGKSVGVFSMSPKTVTGEDAIHSASDGFVNTFPPEEQPRVAASLREDLAGMQGGRYRKVNYLATREAGHGRELLAEIASHAKEQDAGVYWMATAEAKDYYRKFKSAGLQEAVVDYSRARGDEPGKDTISYFYLKPENADHFAQALRGQLHKARRIKIKRMGLDLEDIDTSEPELLIGSLFEKRAKSSFLVLRKAFSANLAGLWDQFQLELADRLREKYEEASGALFDVEEAYWLEHGTILEMDPAEFADSYQEAIGLRVKSISENLRRQVSNLILGWYENEGETMADLQENLAPLFGKTRAELIADTETTTLHSAVMDSTMDMLGLQRWRWNTMRDEVVCRRPMTGPTGAEVMGCRALHGQVFDRSALKPPEGSHPRCRCTPSPLPNTPAGGVS